MAVVRLVSCAALLARVGVHELGYGAFGDPHEPAGHRRLRRRLRLLWLRRRALATGTLFLAFAAWYGTGRVAEDFFRIDETHGLFLTASQWFALAAVITASVLLATGRRPGRRAQEPLGVDPSPSP